MPVPESFEIEKKFDDKIVNILKAEGFTDIKPAEKRRFSPYDFRAFKNGKLCFIEARVRSPKAKTQFFTFRDSKLKHLAQLEKVGDVYIILLNKYGYKIVTLDELLSGKMKEVKFFKYKKQKAYYWTKDGWRKKDKERRKGILSISLDEKLIQALEFIAEKKYNGLISRSKLIEYYLNKSVMKDYKTLKEELIKPRVLE